LGQTQLFFWRNVKIDFGIQTGALTQNGTYAGIEILNTRTRFIPVR
jgi:hypothetical protein